MGVFKLLSPVDTEELWRNHERKRSYRMEVYTVDLPAIASAVEERDLWEGHELNRKPDGTSDIELTYGPVRGNSPADPAGLLRNIVGLTGDDDFSYPVAVDDGVCTENCKHRSGRHYGR